MFAFRVSSVRFPLVRTCCEAEGFGIGDLERTDDGLNSKAVWSRRPSRVGSRRSTHSAPDFELVLHCNWRVSTPGGTNTDENENY